VNEKSLYILRDVGAFFFSEPTTPFKGIPMINSPGNMRATSEAENNQIRIWGAKRKVGTKSSTFPEVSRAPKPSKKGSCKRRRAA